MKTHFSRRELYAFGEPLGDSATYVSAGRRVYGGGGGGFLGDVIGAVGDLAGGVVDAVGNLGQGAIDVVKSAGSSIDDAVRENLPGGWALPVIAATSGALGGESLLGGAAGAGAGEAGLGSLVTDMATAGAYDAGLANVGVNLGATAFPVAAGTVAQAGLPALAPELTGYDAAMADLASSFPTAAPELSAGAGALGEASDLADTGLLADANQSQAEINRLLAQEGSAAGVPVGAGTGLGLGSGLAGIANNLFGSNLTGAGALTALLGGGLGLAGIKSLLDADAKKYGVPGVTPYAGPMNRFNYNPAVFQPTRVDPNMFRPRGMALGGPVETMSGANAVGANTGYPMANLQRGAYSVPYQQPVSQNVVTGANDSRVDAYTGEERLASGGSAKPKYTGKAELAMMQPWQRAQAELNNAAARGRMPTGAQMPQGRLSMLGQYAGGGIASLGGYSDGGRMLKGPGDGMSDSIPATIANKQPARLANEEFVIPADVVSHLGNGSSEAGAKQLYKMMDRVRHARTGTKKQGKEINPGKYMPA